MIEKTKIDRLKACLFVFSIDKIFTMDVCKKDISGSLLVLKDNYKLWLQTCNECNVYINSIFNSLQQISCCKKANLQNSSLEQNFPDIKKKLLVKLSLNCEHAYKKILEKKEILHHCKKKIEAASESVCNSINKVSPILNVCLWKATEPALCDIALWMESFSALINQNYAVKVDILMRLSNLFLNMIENYDFIKETDQMKTVWNDNTKILSAADEVFKYCSAFMS